MKKTIAIDKELLYDTLGTLQEYLLLLEQGIAQPNKQSEVMQVRKLLARLSKAGNLEQASKELACYNWHTMPGTEVNIMDEKVNKLMELLEPCLKQEEIKGSWKYNTAWGYKTEEGLRASMKAILEEK